MRALWASQALLVGPLLADALDGTSPAYRTATSIALWTIWAAVLIAALVPYPVTLTVIRIAMPAAVPAVVWAAVVADSTGWAAVAIGVATLTALLVLHPVIGAVFVDGASYGDERRFLLRVPVLLLLAPVPVAWGVTIVGLTIGPLLLAAEHWIAGVVLTVVGIPLAVLTGRALYGLARRWLVFVPAGIVLHDTQVLADPVLFRRQIIARMGPALADTEATDLTAAALGLALEVDLDPPAEVFTGEELTAFLFTPSLPGAVMAEAEKRRFRIA